MFKNILVAVDGSEHALRAARTAGEIARAFGSNLRLITVYDPVPTFLGEPNLQQAINARLDQAAAVISPALAEIGKIDGELEAEKLEGQVAEAVLAVIEARRIDLVVMGTRGLGRLSSILIGSQSQKVVAHANCPVLLVR
jgi:nucleotide-binding universal stress UspA family protein